MASVKTVRKPISKRLRFKIFQRDSFTCNYCGQKPPKTILEVDHIVPVSKGGDDMEENLITSCFDCNRGKSDKSLTEVITSKTLNTELLIEKELQIKEYNKIVDSIRKRIKLETEEVVSVFTKDFRVKFITENFKNSSIKRFIEELGKHEVIDAMYIACDKCIYADVALRYFCGICWNKIKNKKQ